MLFVFACGGCGEDHPPAGARPDRLKENQEVVGSDEAFFEDDQSQDWLRGLYDEFART